MRALENVLNMCSKMQHFRGCIIPIAYLTRPLHQLSVTTYPREDGRLQQHQLLRSILPIERGQMQQQLQQPQQLAVLH